MCALLIVTGRKIIDYLYASLYDPTERVREHIRSHVTRVSSTAEAFGGSPAIGFQFPDDGQTVSSSGISVRPLFARVGQFFAELFALFRRTV
jgi:hypothetical protein